MKKILIAAIITITATASALGAASSDIHEGVYLRQDVFEAKMDAFMAEIRLMNQQLKSELKQEIQSVKEELHKEIQDTKAELRKEIQANTTAIQANSMAIQQLRSELKQDIQSVKEELRKDIQSNSTTIQANSAAIQATNARLDELKTAVYWGIGLLGLLITLAAAAPYIVKVLQSINIPKPTLTIEDVERLIDAKLQSKNAQ
ncbi:MAG: hypothetical protein IJG51_01875 [Synergistaceae bacterium]|nr:hypothetical protein [Synergistaceae bacterium]